MVSPDSNMLWAKMKRALTEIELRRRSSELSDDERLLDIQRLEVVKRIIEVLKVLCSKNQKSKENFELWLNKGQNPRQTAVRLGISTDSLRAKLIYFDSKLKQKVGDTTIESIIAATSQSELDQIWDKFRRNVISGKQL